MSDKKLLSLEQRPRTECHPRGRAVQVSPTLV